MYQAASTFHLYYSDMTNIMKYQENLSANLPKMKCKQGIVDWNTPDSQKSVMNKSLYKDMPKLLCFQALSLARGALSAPLPFTAPRRLYVSGNCQGMGAFLASTPGQVRPVCKLTITTGCEFTKFLTSISILSSCVRLGLVVLWSSYCWPTHSLF